MKKILFIGIILLGAAWIYHSKIQPHQSGMTTTNNGHATLLNIQRGAFRITFQKTAPITETYMLFGFQETLDPNNSDNITDGYIAGIPISTAHALLNRYPNLGQCGHQGNEQARQAIHNIQIIASTEHIKRAIQHIETSHDQAMRNRNLRICVRIQGNQLELVNATHNSTPIEIHTDTQKFIELSDIFITSCL